VIEVYVDMAQHFLLFGKSFLLCQIITAIIIILAGGFPVYIVKRKMEAHRDAAAEAQFLAEHDNLTGIANRRRLEETAAAALAWSRRSQTQVAALILDLDHFKDINDGYGHAAGDELLRKFAHRIVSTIREEDTVARLGGDEFVILQVGITQPVGAKALAERLLAAFAEPYDLSGIQIQCGSSIGVAIAPQDASDWDHLLSCADTALYKAKSAGRKSVCFFQPGMDASLRERRRIELDLNRALETKAFGLAYQPISSFHEGTLLGFEALLRWPEGWPTRRPEEFIPIAEECGLMPDIGAWVLETTCTTAVAWEAPLKIAVNLSPVQFRQGDIVATVKNALKISGLPANRLELEITEDLWIENTDAVLEQLAQLKRLGVSITLDDFGTGNSSLKYLWKFPFDRVKIDRSFVEEMETNPKAAAVVNTILAMGTTLHLTIAAEGVETLAQAQLLNDSGCDQAQGYLLGRPLSAASANALIKTGLPSRLAEVSSEETISSCPATAATAS
jgi:diguanylate cyclase (GGDEF)-like protein